MSSRYIFPAILIAGMIIIAGRGYAESSSEPSGGELFADSTSITTASPGYYNSDNKGMLDEKVRYAGTDSADMLADFFRTRKVHVKLGAYTNYDDNIFLTKGNRKDDLITHISPGIYAYGGNENNMFFGFYEADALIYSSYFQKETRLNQAMGARAHLFKTGRIKVDLNDTLRPTSDPATSESAPFVRRVNNDFKGAARYDISPKTSAILNYGQELQYYLSIDYKRFNYMQHTVTPAFYYHLSPKTSVSAEYNLGVTNYMGGDDYNSVFHQGRVGLEGKLTQKSTIHLHAGYQYRIYEASESKNAQGFVMEGIYSYKMTPKTTLELIASSDIDESVYSNEQYYKSLNLYAKIDSRLLYNLNLAVNGFYIHNNYPHETAVTGTEFKKRADDLYGAGARLSYKFRAWLSAYAGYDFKTRSSNIEEFEYKDNIISGGVNFSF